PERIPTDRDAQAALYRTQLADKRMLIVLDNARDTAQVRPLLPGAPGCLVLVTSRNRLTSLVAATGAHPLALDLLTADEARDLLTRRLGTRRVAAEPGAVNTLITRCARLPLALAIAAGRAATHPQLPLAALAAELVDTRLDALADTDPVTDIRAVFSWSYRALDTEAAMVFGQLGLAPGPDIGLPAAASLVARSTTRTQVLLQRLDEAHLVQHHRPGRYRMHDLVKLYAAERAVRDLPSQEREAGLRRLVDHYTHTAFAGARLLYPHRPAIALDPPAPGSHPHPLPDRTAALAWFEAEHPHLLATQQTVVEQGWHTRVWQLAWTLNLFHQLRGRRQDDMAVWRAALAAAEHLADPTIQSLTHRHLGHAYAQLGRHDEAVRHLHHALALAEHTNNLSDQALTHRALAWAWEARGEDGRARECARRALRLYQALDQPVWEASALNMMGWFSARLGEHDQARAHCQAALDLCRSHHYLDGEAATLD
ncbi:MAG: tetratricopeptide repeat protein, partial [Pseudonocardiaceae bacterium]